MGQFHEQRLPGESDDYRAARDRLLKAEMDLRRQVEAVAAQRRDLPRGGALKEDYVFEEGGADLADGETVIRTRLSELFAPGMDSLVIYGFMYAPEGQPCPMCNAFLDSLNGNAAHIGQRINLAVVAKAPIGRVRDWARRRGWHNLRLLSSGGCSYNGDYLAETPAGDQLPIVNVFQKTEEGICHRYASEMFFVPAEPGQNPRHVDHLWPLWNLLDLTPEGRGSDWYPGYAYD
ncbi:MAG: DUF899 family protein [Kiloniellales bacterium]|nr:DUF899 family protein [Kiloniellales bacterium]